MIKCRVVRSCDLWKEVFCGWYFGVFGVVLAYDDIETAKGHYWTVTGGKEYTNIDIALCCSILKIKYVEIKLWINYVVVASVFGKENRTGWLKYPTKFIENKWNWKQIKKLKWTSQRKDKGM